MAYRFPPPSPYVALLSAERNTDQAGFVLASAFSFNPDLYEAGVSFVFEAILETSDVGDAARVRLYNVTTSTIISTLNTSLLVPTLLSDSLVSPGGLAPGANIYNVVFALTTGGGPIATLSGAQFRIA